MWSPPLLPGLYDVVVDLNDNGVYDSSVDILDDGRAGGSTVPAGFRVTGTFPPIILILSANPPVINPNGRSTIFGQVQLEDGSPVRGATINFSLRGEGGSLSSNSAVTDQNGIAKVVLTATQADRNLIVSASVTHAGQTAQDEVKVRVRSYGEMSVIFRKR